jgi:hypothetical protein
MKNWKVRLVTVPPLYMERMGLAKTTEVIVQVRAKTWEEACRIAESQIPASTEAPQGTI